MGLIESIINGVSEDDIKSNFFTTTHTAESGSESEDLAKYLGITENPIVNESKKIMIFNIIYLYTKNTYTYLEYTFPEILFCIGGIGLI